MGEGLKRAIAAARATQKRKDWICQCGDTTVIPKGERCHKCGKSEKERS
jgi:hypothetical protein